MLTKAILACSIFIGLLFLSYGVKKAHSGGYAIPPQTAKAESTGGAAVAGVTDPSAVYVNPAGLTQIDGNQVEGGLTYINTISSIKNSGAKSRNIHDDDLLPNLFANYRIPNTKVSLGIGSYTPFGLATSYKPAAFTRYAAIRSELRTMYITPTIAWEPVPYLSIGGGISFVHASGTLSRAIFFGPFGDGHLRITDTDDAYGYKLGMLVKPITNLKFGLTYTSHVDLNFKSANVKFSDAPGAGGLPSSTRASGIHLPAPAVINAGVHWQATPDWEIEFQYDYTRWSEFKHLKASFSRPLPALGGLVPITGFLLPQNWKDSSSIRLGTAYKATSNLELRAGLGFDETPIPSSTLGPAIPGADYLTVTGGIGYKWQRLKLDLGYMAVFYKTRRVTNNILETGGDPNAVPFPLVGGKDKYSTFQNLVGLHATYQF
jgi:long-chain fatty acid transport protein